MTEQAYNSRRAFTAIAGLLTVAATTSYLAYSTQASAKAKGKRKQESPLEDAQSTDDYVAKITRPGVVAGVAGLIGNTPLMRIESLSEMTGCEILGKAEFLNPGGSPKDRVALQILLDAEKAGLIAPHQGDCVFEGTVGSTGISLATLCRAKGYRCSIVLPDDVAVEKSQLLEKLGAEVKKVRPRGIVDPRHFVNEARALAKSFGQQRDNGQGTKQVEVVEMDGAMASVPTEASERLPRGFFADQFETPSNFLAHYQGTGPEIWKQCGGTSTKLPRLDAFVAGAGTGGTLSGVAVALREREIQVEAHRESTAQAKKSWLSSWWHSTSTSATRSSSIPKTDTPIRIVLADPQGSGLYNKVHHGVMYSHTEQEGKRRRHQVDTIVEGIGMNRITQNLTMGVDLVDDAIRVQDEEAVRISRWLSVRDGLFVGSSSSVNVVAAVKTAVKLKKDWEEQGRKSRPTVVTILCDSGSRHLSKFHNDQVLEKDFGINIPRDGMQVDISDML
ncbi:unnamed protein product [Sympodiomycopsis kandeliae]